jgi:hypothetical protein
MKAAKIIIWVLLLVFTVCEFGLCDVADADEGNHCVTCCSLGCCEAIATPSNFVIDSTCNFTVIFAETSFTQSPFLKGLERPPRTPLC